MKSIRVLIVDDCPAMSLGIRTILSREPSLKVVGEFSSIFEVLEQSVSLRPDIMLLDAYAPGSDPMTVASHLREKFPDLKLVFILDHNLLNDSVAVPLSGDGYLVSNAPERKLIDTVLAVATGQRVLDAECATLLLKQYEDTARELVSKKLGLSQQDVDLLEQLAAGATIREMATKMYLSEITVIRKTQRIVARLGASNKTHAVAVAIRRAII